MPKQEIKIITRQKKRNFRCLFENTRDIHTNEYIQRNGELIKVVGKCARQCEDCKWGESQIKKGLGQDIF